MLFMLIVLLVCAAPAFVPTYAPSPLTDFDSLQIKDHEAAAKRFSVQTLMREDTFFRRAADVQPAADEEAAPARRLQQLPSIDGGTCALVSTIRSV